MLYLKFITANVLSLSFRFIKKKVLKISIHCFAFRFALRTLMCHLTGMKHNTINFLYFTQLTPRNTSLTRVNANFKRMKITKFINKFTTHLYNYRKCNIVHNNIGSVEQFIVIVKHL